MRRSIREAMVGFSIVGSAIGFILALLWLYGVRLSAETWEVTADFSNANGLAKQSPVTYRGILVGSVSRIQVTSETVRATLKINQADLRLPLPVIAVLASESLLGGNAAVNLISQGKSPVKDMPMPYARGCAGQGILCDGDKIPGKSAASIASVTESLQRLLIEVEREKPINNLVISTKQIDRVARDASRFLRNADAAVAEADELIQLLRVEVARTKPIITNLSQVTADTARAANHINNIAAALNNQQIIDELSQTASNARALIAGAAAVSNNIESLTNDPRVIEAVRNLTIGLGTLFGELYSTEETDNSR